MYREKDNLMKISITGMVNLGIPWSCRDKHQAKPNRIHLTKILTNQKPGKQAISYTLQFSIVQKCSVSAC